MLAFYTRTRRFAALVLILFTMLYGGLALSRGLALRVLVFIGVFTAIAVLCLGFVAVTAKPRFSVDVAAFWFGGFAVGADCWGVTGTGLEYLTHLPVVVVAICFATVAVILKVESESAKTKDRL